MKRVVVNTLTFILLPLLAFSQYGNPGTINATVKGCEIEVITTQQPTPTATLSQCRIEIFWWTPTNGYKTKYLGYVDCAADTLTFDMPSDIPTDSAWVLKRVYWASPWGTVERWTNSIRIPADCVFVYDTLMPPLDTIPAQPNTSWQDSNTASWTGSNLEITAATQGMAVIMTPEGLLLQVVSFQPGNFSISVNYSGFVFVTIYFWHEGALQVENLKIFLP